jgi:hypothetical protein
MAMPAIDVPIRVDNQTQPALDQVTSKIIQMKAQSAATMQTMRDETEKARASIALLGEDIGVKIPRHLQTLIAESELAKVALNAAFGGIALIAFVDVLEKIPSAFEGAINALAGWNKEAQKAYEGQLKLNKTLIEAEDKHKDALSQLALVGLDGSAKLTKEQQQYKIKIDETTASIAALTAAHAALVKQSQQTDTMGHTGSMVRAGGGTPTPASMLAQSTLANDPQMKNFDTTIADMQVKLQDLKDKFNEAGKSANVAFGDEAKKKMKEFTDGVITSWKEINDQAKANEQLDKDAAAMMKALASEQKQIGNILGTSSAAPKDPLADMKSDFEDISAALKSEKAQEQAIIDKANEYGLAQQTIEQKLRPIRQKTIDDLKDTADQYLRMAKLSGDQTQIENAKKLEAELDAMKIKAQSLSQVFGNDLMKQGLGALEAIATQTKSVSQAFKDMALSIIQEIEKMIIEWLFFKAISGIMSFAAGPAPSVASVNSAGLGSLSSMHFPGFASGGDFSAGSPMIVGENGPELMVPSSAGSIVPNS